MSDFIDNTMLDVIATYNKHDQEWFKCGITKKALKTENTLIDYIREQLPHNEDLVKLSLCWYAEQDVIDEYQTIQESIEKNAKYYFN
jgi:hypothetical protein